MWRSSFPRRWPWRTLRSHRRERLARGYLIIEAKAIINSFSTAEPSNPAREMVQVRRTRLAVDQATLASCLVLGLFPCDYMQWSKLASPSASQLFPKEAPSTPAARATFRLRGTSCPESYSYQDIRTSGHRCRLWGTKMAKACTPTLRPESSSDNQGCPPKECGLFFVCEPPPVFPSQRAHRILRDCKRTTSPAVTARWRRG